MSSPLSIRKDLLRQLQNDWAQTPLAKAFLADLEAQTGSSDNFEITPNRLEKIIQGLGGYQCHPAPLEFALCLTKKVEKIPESKATALYEALAKIASKNSNNSIDTTEETIELSDLLNSPDEFLKAGGLKVESKQKEQTLDVKVEAMCVDPSTTRKQFFEIRSFFNGLENFVLNYRDVSFLFSVFRNPSVSSIEIDQYNPPDHPNQFYLLLIAQSLITRAYVVRLTYQNEKDQSRINWEIIPQNEELKGVVERHYENKRKREVSGTLPPVIAGRKKAFLEEKLKFSAQGSIKIDGTTQMAVSEVHFKGDKELSSERVSQMINGVMVFLFHSCSDPRVHSGKKIQAIPNIKITAELPGLKPD